MYGTPKAFSNIYGSHVWGCIAIGTKLFRERHLFNRNDSGIEPERQIRIDICFRKSLEERDYGLGMWICKIARQPQ